MEPVQRSFDEAYSSDDHVLSRLLRAIAIISIVWGSLRTGYITIWFAYLNSPSVTSASKSTPFFSMYFALGLLSAGASLVLVVAGAGLLMRQPWSRSLLLAAAAAMLSVPLGDSALRLFSLRTYPGSYAPAALIWTSCGAIQSLVFPALIIILLRLPQLKTLCP